MPRPTDAQLLHYFQQHGPQPHADVYAQLPGPIPQQGDRDPQSRQVSPLSTPDNGSPTSPNTHQRQQLRPLYVPAVLRPTEYLSKHGHGIKPEIESHGQGQDDDRFLSSPTSFVSLPGLKAFNLLRRRSTNDSGNSMENDWNLGLFPAPTAPPTRHHWKPDPEATICDEPACLRNFSYWTRRHHCRRCGNIFCDLHSNFGVPLDQDANYNPRGNASSDDSSIRRDSQTAPTSPIITSPAVLNAQIPPSVEAAMSVPRDWHWSTF
ncbi:FYVE zinc finger protein [Xylaria intraflava]|nr:FYVE zinc finger protein [Xylaria intraflava]